MYIYDDIKLIIEKSRSNPLLTKSEELELAEQISTTRIGVWEHTLSYAPFCIPILDFVEPQLIKLIERMQASHDLSVLERCREAARARRLRNIKSNKELFFRACKDAADVIAEIDSGLKLLTTARKILEQPKPFGGKSPPKGSAPFEEYIRVLDTRLDAHRALKERFWLANIRLAVVLAKKYDYGMIPFADLLQEGLLGVMTAVERFDYRKGFKFSTYGTWWVRHALNRFLANHGRTVRWPAHVVADFETLKKARNKLFTRGEDTTIEGLARASGIKPSRVESILSLSTISAVSIDQPLRGFDKEETLKERLSDGGLDIPDESPFLDPSFRKIRSRVHRLPGIEGDILVKRFGLDGKGERTLQEIANEHDLSRERIRQLQKQGLERLRGYVRV